MGGGSGGIKKVMSDKVITLRDRGAYRTALNHAGIFVESIHLIEDEMILWQAFVYHSTVTFLVSRQ